MAAAPGRPPPTVLVMIWGMLRGGPVAWDSIERHLLTPWRADLALLVPPAAAANTSHPLVRRARYLWPVEEPEDWGVFLDPLARTDKELRSYRALARHPNGAFGGVFAERGNPASLTAGSGAICVVLRWLAHERLREHGLLRAYDWFLHTRSDFLFLCPPTNPVHLDPHVLYTFPGYGMALSDRYILVPQRLTRALRHAEHLVRKAHLYESVFRRDYCNGSGYSEGKRVRAARTRKEALGKFWSPESQMLLFLNHQNIALRFVPGTAFLVAVTGDRGRWSMGKPDPKGRVPVALGLGVKYPLELDDAERQCGDGALQAALGRAAVVIGTSA
mmetsp:Transcript_203/g.578  ORF Transcript_203/g.578 Transcript_203/m.578 type:complete len:331 (-) Transcript_203:176-1168(-)